MWRLCGAGGDTVGGEWYGGVAAAGSGSVVVAVTRVSGLAACDEDPNHLSISDRTEWADGRVIEGRTKGQQRRTWSDKNGCPDPSVPA